MSPACGTRSTRRLELEFVLALYLAAAALLPLAHHDITCHLKSVTHCATCNVGSSAESGDAGGPLRVALGDTGAVAARVCAPTESALALAEHGRAPPVVA